MATNLGSEGDGTAPPEPPPTARPSGRRRRPGRESALVWWAVFALLLAAALYLRSWRLALLTLALWCLYQFVLVPTLCRVIPREGFICKEPARGRLFACGDGHQGLKNDALWAMALLRNPFRKPTRRDPNRDTGTFVAAGKSRARIALWPDQLLILTAAAGTLAIVIGMVAGL